MKNMLRLTEKDQKRVYNVFEGKNPPSHANGCLLKGIIFQIQAKKLKWKFSPRFWIEVWNRDLSHPKLPFSDSKLPLLDSKLFLGKLTMYQADQKQPGPKGWPMPKGSSNVQPI